MSGHLGYLIDLFESHDFRHTADSLELVSKKKLESTNVLSDVFEVYEELGGCSENWDISPRKFDIELPGYGILLDLALDYNRYRAITLRSSLYQDYDFFKVPNHIRYCRQFEKECLKAGSNARTWHNKVSKTEFGDSEPPGDLGSLGSSGWKYRAFQNYLADFSPLLFDYKIVRISLYDPLMIKGQLIQLKDLLVSRNKQNKDIVFNFLARNFQ